MLPELVVGEVCPTLSPLFLRPLGRLLGGHILLPLLFVLQFLHQIDRFLHSIQFLDALSSTELVGCQRANGEHADCPVSGGP